MKKVLLKVRLQNTEYRTSELLNVGSQTQTLVRNEILDVPLEIYNQFVHLHLDCHEMLKNAQWKKKIK